MIKSLLITLLVLVSFGGVFATGYFLAASDRVTTVQPEGEPFSSFQKGKLYFDDTVIVVTDDQPRIALLATNVRSETTDGIVQNTRISFFDGTKWERKTVSQSVNDMGIYSNSLVSEWDLQLDPSRVLKEKVAGKITFGNSSIAFASAELQNEMALRSSPGYTKFISESSATLTLNGIDHKAHLLYTKIYSLDSSEIQFYDRPLGITTDWIVFWDAAGNFYHVDKTEVARPTELYKPHAIAILKEPIKGVLKTFAVTTERDSSTPPVNYKVTLGSPLSSTLLFKKVNHYEKSAGWYMGLVEGEVITQTGEKLAGYGLVEYIHD